MSAGFVFPASVIPHTNESILGYLKRLAALLKFDTVSALSNGKLFPTPITDTTIAADVGPLATALGDQWRLLKASRIAPEGSKFSFHGHILERDQLHLNTMRVCPACIEENAYHRNHWHLVALGTCEVHGTPFTDKCPHCSATLSWNSASIDLCSECNERIQPVDTQVRSENGAAAARTLLTICGLCKDDQAASIPPVLAGLSLSDAIDFLNLLGRLQCHIEASDKRRSSPAELVAKGFLSTWEWPSSFYAALKALEALNADRGRSPFALLYPFYREITRVPFRTWGGRIQAALIKHLSLREKLFIDVRHPLGDHVFKMNSFCPIEEVLEVLRMNRGELAQLRESSAWSVETHVREDREWFKYGHVIELKERMTGDVLGHHSRQNHYSTYDWRTSLQLGLPGVRRRERKKPVSEAEADA